MFDIVFLGTSAAAPSIYRGLSAQAILAGEDRFLVDCGEGTQRQILRSGIGFKRLNRILLTHSHLDHILGLGGLVSTFTRWESMDEISIWGGASALERVQALLEGVVMAGNKSPIPIHLNVIEDAVTVHEGKNFDVRAFPVTHRGRGCFGYIFEEHAHRPFLAEKADALGVPAGPERSQLVRGESITLNDGTHITPDMILGDAIPGVKVCITGDIGRTDNIREYVADADVLITEGTFLDSERDEARSFGHITVKQAGELAHEVNVKHLLLTHVSRRYREYDIIKEAQDTFTDSRVVRDLEHFRIRRGQALEQVTEQSEE
ncbi:MAG: MBL fold metallo-hydrolase [Anaerolineae bacterium]